MLGRVLVIACAALVALVACSTPAVLTPKTGPGTSYPCGVGGVECPGHMCCGEGETCGGAFPAVGCPAGQCCFVGYDVGSARGAASHAHPARFPDEAARQMACLDLRDHAVELFADDYLAENAVTLSEAQRAAFRVGWGEELAKKGAFTRFEAACFGTLKPEFYSCGMTAKTPAAIVACMHGGG